MAINLDLAAQQLESALRNNPAVVRELQVNKTKPKPGRRNDGSGLLQSGPQFQQPEWAILARAGLPAIPHDYEIGVQNGQPIVAKKGWWDRNKDWGIPALIAGGAIGGAVAGPAIAGALGGSAPTATVPANAALATGGGAGGFNSLFAAPSLAGTVTGTGTSVAPAVAGGVAGGVGGGTAGATSSLGGLFMRYGLGSAIQSGAGVYGSIANNRAVNSQIEANRYAAELEAKANADNLAFLKEQEAQRRKEFEETQAKNAALEQARLDRLAPYRRAGAGSLAQLMQPISGWTTRL